jgi:hypothetical protein
MDGSSKKKRQAEAANAAQILRLKRLASLSIALMRADAAQEQGFKSWSEMAPLVKSDEELATELLEVVRRVSNNDLSRADGLLALHLASLYAVAEKWKAWGFKDDWVDRLLKSPHLATLKGYRHAVFHVDLMDAKGLVALTKQRDVVDWSKELAAAFRAALRAAWSKVPPWPKEGA